MTSPVPVTAVVHRRIKAGSEQRFEELMQEFSKELLGQPGRLGINVIRTAGDPRNYTVLDRFATEEDRRSFTQSPSYKKWMERLNEVSDVAPQIEEHEGIALWFTFPSGSVQKPVKVRMALVTLMGVYPLTVLIPPMVAPFTAGWPLPFRQLLVAALVVIALTWVVLPQLSKLFRRWLVVESRPAA
ncbi:MAG TPA: antibiotic biosynthesis monooxygenase [Bryobacteraceae bacterium]|nr:antibiotic biosynthesis monooxygenase [Bryobacteraceae bacterium]